MRALGRSLSTRSVVRRPAHVDGHEHVAEMINVIDLRPGGGDALRPVGLRNIAGKVRQAETPEGLWS
jgi:hypothetical protein